MPGARSVCTVTMKLRPVRIDEKPDDEHAGQRRSTTCVLENIVENGV